MSFSVAFCVLDRNYCGKGGILRVDGWMDGVEVDMIPGFSSLLLSLLSSFRRRSTSSFLLCTLLLFSLFLLRRTFASGRRIRGREVRGCT